MNDGPNKFVIAGVAVLAVAALVVGAILIGGNGKKLDQNEKNKILNENIQHVRGNKDSQVKLIIFSDFQCPACKKFEDEVMKNVDTKYGNQIAIIHRHFPLTTIHKNAMLTASASEAADAQGKFWEMHDMLFAKQGEWSSLSGTALSNKMVDYAKIIGISDIEKFKKDLKDSAYNKEINRDMSDARKLGVDSTPSVFLNGENIGVLTAEDMDKKIQEALNATTTTTPSVTTSTTVTPSNK